MPKQETWFRVNEAWWRLWLGGQEPDNRGDCSYSGQTITVDENAGVWETLETVLHESAHAALPLLSEEAVEALGVAQASAVRALMEAKGWELRPQQPESATDLTDSPTDNPFGGSCGT